MTDSRIPIVFGSEAGADDVALRRVGQTPGHVPGCACCRPRSGIATELGRLFMARARGEVAFFRRVVADQTDAPAVRAALAGDVVVRARFRLG